MRKLFLIAILLLITGTFFFWRWLQQPEIYPIDATSPIVFFGDSLVYGVGAKKGNDMPSLLSEKLDREIINRGIPGDTTRDGLGRLEKDVLSLHPGLVILLLGGNDYLQKIEQEETFGNLAEIIDRIEASGSQVLLVGVRGGILLDGYNENYAHLSRMKKVVYVTDILEGVLMDPTLKADQIHPNDDGYKVMADRLELSIKLFLR